MSTTARGKHPHYEVIVAWAEGNDVQVKLPTGKWSTIRCVDTPRFSIDGEYRVKLKPTVVRYRLWLARYKHSGFRVSVYTEDHETTAPDKSVDYFVRWLGDWQTIEIQDES